MSTKTSKTKKATTPPPPKTDWKNRNKENAPGNCSLVVWNVPKKVKDAFQVKCKKRGVTMKEELIAFMIEFSKRPALVQP